METPTLRTSTKLPTEPQPVPGARLICSGCGAPMPYGLPYYLRTIYINGTPLDAQYCGITCFLKRLDFTARTHHHDNFDLVTITVTFCFCKTNHKQDKTIQNPRTQARLRVQFCFAKLTHAARHEVLRL